METSRFFTLFLPMMASLFLGLKAHAEDPVRILSGGPAAVKKLEPMRAELEKIAGVRIEINVTPFDLAIGALSKGLVDAVVSPPLKTALAAAEKRGIPKQNSDDYQFFHIANVTLWIGVHPNNPVKSLTREQISGILSGSIKNWQSINGQDAPISVVIPKNYLASMKAVTKFYINADESPVAEYVGTYDGLLKSLQKNPNQLGIFTTNDGKGDFQPKFFRSEARHELIFVARKNARPAAQKVFDYLKENVSRLKD